MRQPSTASDEHDVAGMGGVEIVVGGSRWCGNGGNRDASSHVTCFTPP